MERKRENGNIILKKETSKRLKIFKDGNKRENINGIIKWKMLKEILQKCI